MNTSWYYTLGTPTRPEFTLKCVNFQSIPRSVVCWGREGRCLIAFPPSFISVFIINYKNSITTFQNFGRRRTKQNTFIISSTQSPHLIFQKEKGKERTEGGCSAGKESGLFSRGHLLARSRGAMERTLHYVTPIRWWQATILINIFCNITPTCWLFGVFSPRRLWRPNVPCCFFPQPWL